MPNDPDQAIVDFDALRRRVGGVLIPVVGLGLLGVIVDGAINGLTFALLGRWVGLIVVVAVLAMAVVTALHALGGAGRAGARGERLASPDVGIAPRRFHGRSLRPLDDAAAEPADGVAGEGEGGDGPGGQVGNGARR